MSDWTKVKPIKKTTKTTNTTNNNYVPKESSNGWDWGVGTTVIKGRGVDKKKTTGETVRSQTTGNRQSAQQFNTRKLDEAEEASKIKTVPSSIAQNIIKFRAEKKLTQKDLVQKTNGRVKENDLKLIEQGKAIFNNQQIVAIEKALNVHVRGNSVGEPYFNPKPKKTK